MCTSAHRRAQTFELVRLPLGCMGGPFTEWEAFSRRERILPVAGRRNPSFVAENDDNLLFEGADSVVRAALGSGLLRFAWSSGRREIRLPDDSPRDGRLSSKPATRSRFRCRTAYDAHRRAQAFEPIRLPSGWMPASWRRIDRNCGNGGSTAESRFRSIVRQKMGGVSGRFRLPGAGCGPRAAPSPQAGGAGYEFSTIGARLGKVCYTPCWKR